MPVATAALNLMADHLVSVAILIRLHTGDPGSDGTANRVSGGGGSYTSGVSVAASGWSAASDGDVHNVNAIDFGTAAGSAPGTVTHWSAYRGGTFIASNTLQSRAVAVGDSFSIAAESLVFDLDSAA